MSIFIAVSTQARRRTGPGNLRSSTSVHAAMVSSMVAKQAPPGAERERRVACNGEARASGALTGSPSGGDGHASSAPASSGSAAGPPTGGDGSGSKTALSPRTSEDWPWKLALFEPRHLHMLVVSIMCCHLLGVAGAPEGGARFGYVLVGVHKECTERIHQCPWRSIL